MELSKTFIQKQLGVNVTSDSPVDINCIEDEFDDIVNNGSIPVPFVKWAGGKRCLIKELKAHLPNKFDTYFEPFVGGGALFFSISKQIKNVFLSDSNFE